jgi:hypothetical protein
LEQYVRDAKIDTLYEGTTAIQGQDFFFRKIVKDDGWALSWLWAQIEASLDDELGGDRLATERELLKRGLDDVRRIVAALVGYLRSAGGDATSPDGPGDPRDIYKVGQNTTRLLMAAGDLVVSWLLIRQAAVALDALDGSSTVNDRAFYDGKVAAARFFAHNTLPRLGGERAAAETTDNTLMDLDEDAF